MTEELDGLDGASELLDLLKQLDKSRSENLLDTWEPIPKQWDFLNCKLKRKALVGANQIGKSKTLMYELAVHTTGKYPKNWKGIRFDRPVEVWLVGETTERVRDTLQKTLIGDIGEFGTGMIPLSCLDEKNGIIKKPMVPGAVQKVKIKHVSGGWSSIQFFSYSQKREDFQGSTIDIVAFDEEPPNDIHGECVIRIAVKDGYMLYSFTPLKGQTDVWSSIVADPHAKYFQIAMDDVPWMNEEKINRILENKGYSEMEKRARRYGIPAVGSGMIFQFEEDQYACESFNIPSYWPRLGGLDIGRNHPVGAIALAFDRQSGCIYVYQEYRKKDSDAPETSRNIKHWNVKFAASHDAFSETFGRGETVAEIFKEEGISCFSAGRDTWARIHKVRQLIGQGRLWIFKDRCPMLVDEFKKYHTKENGVDIYKVGDDLVDALTHAVMFHEKATVGLNDELQGISINTPNISSDHYY